MEQVNYNGWEKCIRLANQEIELIVTTVIGPRIIRFGFQNEKNMFTEISEDQGGRNEKDWKLRGGHRFWIAPELKPRTYELDNSPVETEVIPYGIRTRQPPGALSECAKTMEISLDSKSNTVRIVHTLTNHGSEPIHGAPWALSVMAPNGMAVIPLPARIPHTERVLHNQEWTLWGYTDLTDPRWTLGPRYIFLRQDINRGPNKLGIAHREGWGGYLLDEFLFVKRFDFNPTSIYPDGGVNFEVFTNESFLEMESLAGLANLEPGASLSHMETWELHRGIPHVNNQEEADKVFLQF